MVKVKLFLIRHGMTDACTFDYQGDKNIFMNATGRNQIELCLEKLTQFPLPRHITFYTSPTLRTKQTTELLQSYFRGLGLGLNLNIVIEPRLYNKQRDFYSTLRALLDEISSRKLILKEEKDADEWMFFVTHGRIIKMVFSILTENRINTKLTDSLSIDYANIFLLEWQDTQQTFNFTNSSFISL